MSKRMVRLGLIVLAVMMFGPIVWAVVKPALTAAVLIVAPVATAVLIVAPVATALYVFPATRPMVVRHGMRLGVRVLRLGRRWGRKGARVVWR